MRILKILLFLLLLFFINLFFVKSSFKNDENYNVPLNVLFNNGKHIRKRLCNECFYKNEVNLIFNSCKALENVKYTNVNGTKIMYFIKQSPKMIKKYISKGSIARISEILSIKSIKASLFRKNMILLSGVNLLRHTYFRYSFTKSVTNFLQSILLRFLVVYFIQLCSSFLLFYYVNMILQKIQVSIFFISGSKLVSRIIGFIELNLVNYYIIVLCEIVQIFIIRILYNQYEVFLIKEILYNSEDYLLNSNLKNKYVLLYQCIKFFVIKRFNKLSLFTFNYLRYFVLTNLFFKLFNGTYNKFSPSNVKMPGVYSDPSKSIEKDMKYATKKEINILRTFCKQAGCHTCGVKCHEKFIGDHQPPVQVIKDMIEYYKKRKMKMYFLKLFKIYDTKQRLYPQCLRCSQMQSASVRCKKLRLIPHYQTIRLFHFSTVFYLFLKMLLLTKWKKIFAWDSNNV